MSRLRKLITDNFSLKLLALFLAMLMWFLVTNLDDPSITVRFYNIPVNIRNTGVITGQGKVYEVLDGTDTISSVAVVAPRSIADTFTRDNIIATADMNNLSSLDTLSITLTTNKYANQIESITGSIDTVRLSIEDSKTKTLALSALTTGGLEEGYIIGQITTEQNVLRITGPESAVDRVVTASVSVDVTGFTTDIDTDAEIDLYDADGNEVTDDTIRKNIDDVRVAVSILQTKRVPIRVSITGTPADGYLLTGNIEVTPDSVLLAGKGSNFTNLDELVLTGQEFDVTDLNESLETAVNIRSFLPSGVSLGDGDFGGQVSVSAEIVEAQRKELELPVSRMELRNVPEGMKATIQTLDLDDDGAGDGLVDIVISGLPEAVQNTQARDITGILDIAEVTERLGVEKPANAAYTVTMSLVLPEGVTQAETVRVLVYLEDAADE